MMQIGGSSCRLARSLWRRRQVRLLILGPAIITAFLCTTEWCAPDGIAPAPVDSFLFSLHSLETEHARKVRVLHFGDSHIAADTESSVVRSYLQSRFGDGGPGLMLPWGGPRLPSLNITFGNTAGWVRLRPTYTTPVDDTGLGLSFVEAASPNQAVWIQAPGSEFSVYYLAQPAGGSADFYLDGQPAGQKSLIAASVQVQVAHFQAVGDSQHRLDIRTRDYGRVRILGVAAERSTPGLVYSALGMNGARAEYLLKCREETFVAQVAEAHPDLVILGYGTNESTGSYLDGAAYGTALATIIARLHRAAPSALVVLLTPPDRGDTRPAQAQHIQNILQTIIVAQRDVAQRFGAVVINLHAAMGGPGSAARWATLQPPLARPDMTHFTNEGYNLLGRYIVGGIMRLYDAGAGGGDASSAGQLEANGRLGEILPPLYQGSNRGRPSWASLGHEAVAEASAAPVQIYYFQMNDGQLVVTNDLSTIDSEHGKVISPEEARCLLRGRAAPCDNAAR
jgi:lysophospholipase L1-like esterase